MAQDNSKNWKVISDDLWLSMHDESIFITGGTGFFGRSFIKGVLDANARLGTNIKLIILTRNARAFVAAYPHVSQGGVIEFLEGDVVDFLFPKSKVTSIMHMATTSAAETFHGEGGLEKFHMLVRGTERVMQFAVACEAKRILFTSSGVVYGAYPAELQYVPESYSGAPDTTDAASALGQAKRAAEFICGCYADKYNIEYVIARCFSFIGPELPLNLHYAVGNFIRDSLFADAVTVKGDGSPVRSYLYVDDLVVWLQMLLCRGLSGRIYNVGSDCHISIRDLACLVRDLVNPAKPVNVMGGPGHTVGNFSRNWYVPDIARARGELGLDVWTGLSESILSVSSSVRASQERV